MEIKIHSAVNLDSKFKEFIEEKFSKLNKFVFEKGQASLYITKERHLYLTKIKIATKKFSVFLEDSDADIRKSIESLNSRTKRQLRKYHDKITNKPRN